MAEEFIKNPTRLIRQLLPETTTSVSFEAGRAAMACEIVTLIRTLEDFEDLLPAEHSASIISVLQTLISDQDLNWIYTVYDQLSANRRPTFVPEPAPSTTDDAAELYALDPQRGPVFADEVQQHTTPPVERLRALSLVRRSQDDETTDEQLELTAEVDEETSSE